MGNIKKPIKEEGVITQKISLKRTAITTAEAFGVTPERKKEILDKLIAVAKIYYNFSIISEVFLNCADRFTEKERLYGLYELGKVAGAAGIMKQTGIKIHAQEFTMNGEIKLLSLLSQNVVIDPVLKQAMQ